MTSVRYIACTLPSTELGEEGVVTPGELIAYCARVSNPANQANKETSGRLLSYLVRNKHWSPFEMVSLVLEVKTTRAIAHQIIRHRSFAFQEFSQRYAQVMPEWVISEARLQDAKNRQASHETEDQDLQRWWTEAQLDVAKKVEFLYAEALHRGIAKEVARNILPEGLTPSTLYMSGTVRSWIHYVQLRGEAGTQKEHREVALGAKSVLLSVFPELAGVLEEVGDD